MGNVIIVAATILPTYNGVKDYFKIKQLAGGFDNDPLPNTEIPEPSAVGVIVVGLAAICVVRRRRRTL